MGNYSPKQNFYLTDPDELVNVEQDLNYNIRLADARVRPLVEYQWTDAPNIGQSDLPKDTGFKWYKARTNTIWAYTERGSVTQDPNSQVNNWRTDFVWAAGYGPLNNNIDSVAATVYNGMVRLRGMVVLNGGATDLPVNTSTNVFELPVALKPVDPQYFTIYGGNAASGDYQVFRFFIPGAAAGNQNCQFHKYGGTASGATERFMSLNNIFYSLDD